MPRFQLPELTRAVCHPKRPHVEKGLCRQCLLADEKNAPVGSNKLVRKRQFELMEMHKNAEHIASLYDETKAIMRDNAPKYAELHYQAAAAAAEKGDSRPAEWALQNVKMKDAPVIDPPAKEPVTSGVRVFVGINMGGVPMDTMPTIQMVNPVSEGD